MKQKNVSCTKMNFAMMSSIFLFPLFIIFLNYTGCHPIEDLSAVSINTNEIPASLKPYACN